MTLAIVDEACAVTGGVDTHAGTHVAAALDLVGGLLGVEEFRRLRWGMCGCWPGCGGLAR